MTRTRWRFAAVLLAAMSALSAYVLQPAQLELFSNPKLVAAIVGGLVIVLNIASNYLPSISGNSAGDV